MAATAAFVDALKKCSRLQRRAWRPLGQRWQAFSEAAIGEWQQQDAAARLSSRLDDMAASLARETGAGDLPALREPTSQRLTEEGAQTPTGGRRRGSRFRGVWGGCRKGAALEEVTTVPPSAASTSTELAPLLRDSAEVAAGKEGWLAEPGAGERPVVATDPTALMLQRQVDNCMEKLAEDRPLQWQRDQIEANRRLAKVLNPPPPVPLQADELDDEVVEKIFDEMVVDPGRELAARTDSRIRESMAVHLEQLLSCAPPAALKQPTRAAAEAPSSAPVPLSRVRIVSVQEQALSGGGAVTLVLFSARTTARERAAAAERQGHSDALQVVDNAVAELPEPLLALEHRLNDATHDISVALARRMMVSLAPRLVFRAVEEAPQSAPASPLWHVRRRERKLNIHTAARSWTAAMHWS
eukprot:TRINITY_DN22285_c0_g1_i1.p1 TRINITY_DN22285_c0_g1~~TRINITY_DN22285_c0_g1_i1.p1  ORF type:complete len:438 (-),score=90.92 TRINITY_DN22285_c0_g1_i1:45-1283(-)